MVLSSKLNLRGTDLQCFSQLANQTVDLLLFELSMAETVRSLCFGENVLAVPSSLLPDGIKDAYVSWALGKEHHVFVTAATALCRRV